MMIKMRAMGDKEGDDNRASSTRDRSHLLVVPASHQQLIQGVRNLAGGTVSGHLLLFKTWWDNE